MKLTAASVLVALTVLLPSAAGAKSFPTRVQVTAKEFWFTLSNRTVKPGAAVVEFVNYGQDLHDLRIQRLGTTKVYGTPVIDPGKYYDLKLDLAPGRYQLWCSIANHRKLGMQAVLVVAGKK